MFDYETFRVNLILNRKKLKLTQEVLANMADISEKNLSKIELGKQNPNLQTILSILNAFNTTPSAFMSKEEDNKKIVLDSINGYIEHLNDKEKRFLIDLINTIHKEV